MLIRLRPFLLLTFLGLVFFTPLVLHPTGTLYAPGSDLLAEHVPAKTFLVRSWRETGELPLWCPDQFGGAPFAHDIQVGLFYPPYWILLLLPPEAVGAALSWLIVAHVILAGWCMYVYGRWQGLGAVGATVAAIGFMFAGKWMFHLLDAGHTILIGLAWLPLFLLLIEMAIRRVSLVLATAAGAVFALMILGTQPQWTYYSALFAVVWTLGTALESAGWLGAEGPRSWQRTAAALGRWLGLGVWAAVVAGALGAVQLMPTLEAAAQSSRGPGVPPDELLPEYRETIHQLIGPAPVVARRWEHRAGLGVLWLAAAVLAPVLRRGRVRWQTAVWLLLWALALGGGTLLQERRWLGFGTFKLHVRLLIIAALPTALLAGGTTDALFGKAAAWSRGRRTVCFVLAVVALTAGVVALGAEWELGVWETTEGRFPVYAVALLALLPAGLLLLAARILDGTTPARWATIGAWLAVLLLDLWAISWPLVDVRDERDLYRPSDCVSYVIDQRNTDRRTDRWRVLDCGIAGDTGHNALGAGCPLALMYDLEAIGGYSPLDVHRFRDYLMFIDDHPEPMEPFDHGPYGYPIFKRIPVRNKRLVDLLGVRYLLQPRDVEDQPDEHLPASEPGWRLRLEDDHARAFSFTLGGVRPLPPYAVWENTEVTPRAFVVPWAAPLPDRPDVLDALKQTDFKQTVLLEGWRAEFAAAAPEAAYHAAAVTDYRPNRVTLHTDGSAGWLVLTDVWFPGWKCTVNGKPADIHRADFLFRAVAVPDGPCDVVFTFEPESYLRGRELSLGAAALVLLLFLGAGVRRFIPASGRRKPADDR